jgi:hypothetical protein
MSAEVLDLVEKLRQDIDAALGDLSSELESLRRRIEALPPGRPSRAREIPRAKGKTR